MRFMQPNTSFWYFLHTRYRLKPRIAKRQAARFEREKYIRVKRFRDWHRCHELNAGLIKIEWRFCDAEGKVINDT